MEEMSSEEKLKNAQRIKDEIQNHKNDLVRFKNTIDDQMYESEKKMNSIANSPYAAEFSDMAEHYYGLIKDNAYNMQGCYEQLEKELNLKEEEVDKEILEIYKDLEKEKD